MTPLAGVSSPGARSTILRLHQQMVTRQRSQQLDRLSILVHVSETTRICATHRNGDDMLPCSKVCLPCMQAACFHIDVPPMLTRQGHVMQIEQQRAHRSRGSCPPADLRRGQHPAAKPAAARQWCWPLPASEAPGTAQPAHHAASMPHELSHAYRGDPQLSPMSPPSYTCWLSAQVGCGPHLLMPQAVTVRDLHHIANCITWDTFEALRRLFVHARCA